MAAMKSCQDKLDKHDAHDQLLDSVMSKHDEVDPSLNTVLRNWDKFKVLDRVVHATPVLFRAVSNGAPASSGKAQGTTYHWGCYRKQSGTKYTIKIRPNFGKRPPKQMIPPLNKRRSEHCISRRAHQDYLEAMSDAGCKAESQYKEPEPFTPMNKTTMNMINARVFDYLYRAPTTPNFFTELEKDVKAAIKTRIEDYEEKYRVSNDPFNLTRAIFWRNLKYEDISDYHRYFTCAVYRDWHNLDYLEYELRTFYEEQVMKKLM